MPTLVQFSDLAPQHFDANPVWASCHSFDYDEPWYDQTDEETFRPWEGALPVDPASGMFLVRATLQLADGTSFPGFATPAPSAADGAPPLGQIQPQLFLPSGQFFGFWLGMFGNAADAASAFYDAVHKSAASVFPIQVRVDPSHWQHEGSLEIAGFYTVPDGSSVVVSR